MWLEIDSFCDLVKSCHELTIAAPSSFILAKKLNFLKTKFKEWNMDLFGHLDLKMANLVEKVKSSYEKE